MMRILVLCTGNSARSILGEGLINHLGQGKLTAVSAGSQPTGTPNPHAIDELQRRGIDTGFAASKSWDVFAGPDAPQLDLIITVCDSAAAETCPIWPGHPAQVHWGMPDPAGHGPEAFRTTADALERKINALLALPLEQGATALRAEIAAIGA